MKLTAIMKNRLPLLLLQPGSIKLTKLILLKKLPHAKERQQV